VPWYEARFPALQWGRSFEAAETFEATVDGCQIYVLQWGRSFEAAETASTECIAPSRRYCFNGAAALRLRKQRARNSGENRAQKLQWGRSFEAAETSGRILDSLLDAAASMGPQL